MTASTRDLDVITIGSIMAELSPAVHSQRVIDADRLVLAQAGSATNFAVAFARLGGRLGLIARTGADELGQWITATLEAAGVDVDQVRRVDGQLTPVSIASVDSLGAKSFSFYRFPGFSDPLATLRAEEVPDAFLARSAILTLTESMLRFPESRTVAFELATRAQSLGCTICLSPNFRVSGWSGGAAEAGLVLRAATAIADLVVMNSEEAQLIADASTLESAVAWFEKRERGRQTVITHGEQPVILIENGQPVQIAVPPTQVVFDVGAGDMFLAALLAEVTHGVSLERAVRFATKAAALKIGRPPGVDHLPTRSEVESRS